MDAISGRWRGEESRRTREPSGPHGHMSPLGMRGALANAWFFLYSDFAVLLTFSNTHLLGTKRNASSNPPRFKVYFICYTLYHPRKHSTLPAFHTPRISALQ